MSDIYSGPSVAIIGAGPAGMACGLWLKNLRFTPLLLEKESTHGGWLSRTWLPNNWVLGFSGMTSKEIFDRYTQHARNERIPLLTDVNIKKLTASDKGGFDITYEYGELARKARVDAVVLATGSRTRTQEIFSHIPGFKEMEKEKLWRWVNNYHPDFYSRRVAVMGGGDNAYETAINTCAAATHVSLIMRGSPRACAWMQREAAELERAGKLSIYKHFIIDKFSSDARGARIHGHIKTKRITVICDDVIARVGFMPNSEEVKALIKRGLGVDLKLGKEGHIAVDKHQRTNIPFLYAIGDVANNDHPSVATSLGEAAIAARTIEKDLRKHYLELP